MHWDPEPAKKAKAVFLRIDVRRAVDKKKHTCTKTQEMNQI